MALSVAAHAHVAVEYRSLRQYVQHSAAALEVEILSPVLSWQAPDGRDRQDYFRARSVASLAGAGPQGIFEFFPHAEGLPAYVPGERALLFLERTDGSPELASLAERFPFFSAQRPSDVWPLGGAEGEATRAQARAYAALASLPAEQQVARLRELLLRALVSPWERLRRDGRGELVVLRDHPGVFARPEDVSPFVALLAEPALPLGERAALARLLDGAAGFELGQALGTLTAQARSADDRRALVTTLASAPQPEAAAWIAAQLREPDPGVRRQAAAALRRSRRSEHVEELAAAAHDPDHGVAREATDALAAIGGATALRALHALAAQQDAERAHWATVALRRLGQQTP